MDKSPCCKTYWPESDSGNSQGKRWKSVPDGDSLIATSPPTPPPSQHMHRHLYILLFDEMTQKVRILTAPTCGPKFQSQNPHHTSVQWHLNTSSQTHTLCANTHTQSREKLKSKINKYIIKVHMYTLKQIIFYDKLC